MKMLRTKLMLIVMIVFLTGCWDTRNLELQYYVNALGVDYKEGQYEVYVQILNFQAMPSGGEARKGDGSPLYVGFAKGTTIVEALHELYSFTDRRIYWGHISSLIITENALRQENGIIKAYDGLSRYEENRHTLWGFVTTSSLSELLTIPILLEISPIFSFLGEPSESYEQSSFVEPLRLHRIISMVDEPGQTTIFPILEKVDVGWLEMNKKPHANLKITGAGVLEGTDFKGLLVKEDMKGIRWLQESTVRTPIVLEKAGEPIATMIVRDPKVKKIPKVEGNEVTFSIEIEVSVSPIEYFENLSTDEIKKEASRIIEQEIRSTYEKGLELDADVLQLSHSLYKENTKVWKKATDNGILPLTSKSLRDIKVIAQVYKSGKDKLKVMD